ncbi:hypothetical protein ACFLRP_03555 [Bacteroidota bacterium]
MGTGALGCEHGNNDSELHHIAGGVELITEPAHVKLGAKNQVNFVVSITNSGNEPILAWAVDLSEDLYLVKAIPSEQTYHQSGHRGDQEDEHEHNGNNEYEHNADQVHGHGNVLIYGIPIASGDSLKLELNAGVLFDMEGKFHSDPELRFFYARGPGDSEKVTNEGLQVFQDTLLSYPFVEMKIQIEK